MVKVYNPYYNESIEYYLYKKLKPRNGIRALYDYIGWARRMEKYDAIKEFRKIVGTDYR